ncbi:hypothetical protein L1889_03205 [Paenalcaligenes niemegkensis]|uniref:hypothetical protein n=1 Tax=Paenalcaligenes niemegkensis TaxID=2895469 RepID=UPI001EE841A6|nr:hypothetical protein [Paenalcaligenes niemegkensis]MCQ9615836.1 hypothetical protein [Paenalcaligenes niemegkensis]
MLNATTRSTSRHRSFYPLLLWVVLLVVAGLLAYQLHLLFNTHQDSQRIERLAQGYNENVDPDSDSLVLLFAKAHYLSYREQFDDATLLTEILASRASTAEEQILASDSLYNLANARLRQGIEWLEQGRLDRAGQSLNLARDYYTRTLMLVPDHWSARYNLDITARMARQLPRHPISEDDEITEVKNPEELWSEIPGIVRGLP